ncbi:hypothetical protein Thpro_022080 [Acidihalobacter prosperus]|uniref:Type I-E CRISPR-associated protein Cas6/Cse3/CasE n=2 Tax=Acidihalobacter prosperus TaxID=160660 RepID=A0A1A6C325_9GAMM|nr:hypothetical protein Thpro_022080 [Acidihalobacter prosperus]
MSTQIEDDCMIDVNAIHKSAWAKATDGAPCAHRPFLFDFRQVAGRGIYLYTRPLGEASPLRAGHSYPLVVRLAATHRAKNPAGKIVERRISEHELPEWLGRIFARHGMRVDGIQHAQFEPVKVGRGGLDVLSTVMVAAQVLIEDEAKAAHAWGHGIGRGKAWGCGTLMLRH